MTFIGIGILLRSGGGGAAAKITLNTQTIGQNTLSGVKVNPIFSLAAGATITGGNGSGHFAISGGYITVTSTGDAANLNAGPYTLSIGNDPTYKNVVIPIGTSSAWYSVTNSTEVTAAYDDAFTNFPSAYAKCELLDFCTINPRSATDTSQTYGSYVLAAKGYTSSINPGFDGFTGTVDEIEPRVILNGATATASYTGGGSFELTCSARGFAYVDQVFKVSPSMRGVIVSNLAFVGTSIVTMYIPTATAKWLPNQVAGFSGGLTPGTNEIGASITASGIINSVTRTAAGTGGTSGTYNWTTTGGGGTGATGTFTVSAGAITTVTTSNGGSGYTGIPTVVLDPAANLTGAVITASLGYSGGTGYMTGETWSWTDGVDTISGTITATAGVITAATITTKTAGIDAKMTGPILLTTVGSGNGITSASGVNGTIAITHDNYAFGPPPGSATYSLLNNTQTNACQVDINGSVTAYPANAVDIIFRNCVFGGYTRKPNQPWQWVSVFGNAMRWARNVVVEDCQLKGFRNGIYIGFAREAHIRRNDIQQNYEDAIRIFESSAWSTPSQMNASGPDDFADSGTRKTVHIYLNDIHNNVDIVSFQNLHSDGAQWGTFVDSFGGRGVIWNNRSVMPTGSTQGIVYNDDAFSAPGGFTFKARQNLVLTGTDQANAMVAFRGNGTQRSTFSDNTLIQMTVSKSQNTAAGATVVRRGNGTGYKVQNNIYGCFWNDTQYSFGGTSVTTAGTGYVTGDGIIITNAYGVVGYGTLTASGGAITGVTWTVEPTGFGSLNGLSTAGTKALSSFTSDQKPDANLWCRLYSDTGSGGVVKALAGALDSEIFVYTNGTKNYGYGQNAYTVDLIGNTSVRPITSNTGAGTALDELFNGSFTRIDNATTAGWSLPTVDHTPANFRAAIDAIFTPKAGSAAAGKGHLYRTQSVTADTTTMTADTTAFTADAA